jgi:hypothetical protein
MQKLKKFDSLYEIFFMKNFFKNLIKNKDSRVILFMFILTFLFFLPVFTKGWVVFPDLLEHYRPWKANIVSSEVKVDARYSSLKSDFVDGYFPYVNIIKESILKNEITLWNDIADLGKPFLFHTIQILFSPLHLFMWFLPVDIGFTLSILLKALVASLGMYFWLRKFKVRRFLAVFVAIVFLFSGFNSSWFLGSAATINLFTPWAFLLVDDIYRGYKKKDIFVKVLYLALLLAFFVISGFIAGAGYVFYLISGYVLVLTIVDIAKLKKKKVINIYHSLLPGICIFFSIILAVGVSSIILLPSLDWLNFINVGYRRVANASHHFPLRTAIQLFFPNYYGNPIFGNWNGFSNWNETSFYITILLAITTPLGVFFGILKRNTRILTVAILSTFCVFMIWNITPLFSIVNNLPIFDSSSSTRLLGPLTFFLATLGAVGLETLFNKGKTKLVLIYSSLATVILVFFTVWKALSLRGLDFRSLNLLETNVFSFLSVVYGLIFILLFLFFQYLYFKCEIGEKLFVFVIGFILILDVFLFSQGHIPMVPREYFYPKTETTTFLKENIENGRLLVFDGQFMISGTQLFYGINSALTHNLHTEREKELVDYLTEKAWASATAPMLHSEYTNFDSPIFDLYGVKYVSVAPSVTISSEKWILALDVSDEGRLYENVDYIDEKYWFSSNYTELSDEDTFFENIENVANRSLIYIEDFNVHDTSVKSSGDVEILVLQDNRDNNELKICVDESGILTVRESYWPGWEITIDGEPTEVFSTNYIYRGIFLQKGCYTVVERFVPSSWVRGFTVSAFSLGVIVLLFFFLKLKNRRVDTPKGEEIEQKRLGGTEILK